MAGDPNVNATLNSTQWAASVALLLVLLVPVAIGLAWWFKRRYAQAVVRLQASTADGGSAPELSGPQAVAAASAATQPALQSVPPLRIELIRAGATPITEPDPIAAPRRLRRRVLLVQFVLGLGYWFGLTLMCAAALGIYAARTQQPDAGPADPTWSGALMLLPAMFVPPLLAWAIQGGARESVAWWVIVVGAVLLAVGMLGTGMGVLAALTTPLLLSGLGLTMTAFLRPAVRGAGPSLIAAMIVALLVFSAFSMVAVALDDRQGGDDWGSWTEVLAAVGLLAGVAAISAWIGWRMLLRISRRYGRKRFSELQLALGTYWGLMTLFVLAAVLLLSFEEATGGLMEWVGLAVLLMWLAWRGFQRLALRWAVRRAAPGRAPLLLLRVFKPSNRSEAFMDRFLARWRFAGPVWMIGGPDLAGALMEPDEFFSYLRRTLAERFISDATRIPERLAALDGERDPDGRFRVSELFCSNTTWRPAVLEMIERAGVILLDLREYNASRAGTRYELQELLRRAPLERVLFLTDEAGEAPQLRAAIDDVWRTVGHRSGQTVRIAQLAGESDAELDGLFRVAAGAGAVASRSA